MIATLALAGPRVTELCQLNVDDVDLAKARFSINDSKTPAGIRVIAPVLSRANQIRATQERPPIRAHVTPHTFRRTYITYMIAAGYDLPYVQAQVGHVDPAVTFALYAHVMRRADRDRLRAKIADSSASCPSPLM